MRSLVPVALVVAVCLCLATSDAHQIIDSTDDDKPIDRIEQVADVLCQWTSTDRKKNYPAHQGKQISRISTVDRLVSFFENETTKTDDIYSLCADRYRQILDDLNLVLKTRPDNVCSEQKLAAIERFHKEHLSTTNGTRMASNSKVNEPHPMLGLFFMYYTMEVSAICKRSVLHSLEWDLGQFKFSQEEYQLGENNNLAQLLAGMSDYLGPMDRISDLDDVVYLWDLLDYGMVGKIIKSTLLVDEEAEAAEREGSSGTNGIRLLIKIKNGHEARFIQNKCLNRFRPIYSQVIMPVTRLSNLGYSSQLESFKRDQGELVKSELLKCWYSIAQICEAIRPIKFYEDSTLGPNDAVIMTKSEADKLEEAALDVGEEEETRRIEEYEPKTNSMLDMDRLYSMDKKEWQELVKRVKLNVSAHDRSIGRILARLLRNSLSVIKSKVFQSLGRIFIFRKSPGADAGLDSSPAVVKCDLKRELRESIDQLSDEEIRELELRAAGEIGTNKATTKKGDHDDDKRGPVSFGNGIILNIVNACASLTGGGAKSLHDG